jgi:hypothetical protein
MNSRDIDTILLLNKFICESDGTGLRYYLVKKIMDAKIKSFLQKKKSISLPIMMLCFIFAVRFGL